jgi:hypothetical protein
LERHITGSGTCVRFEEFALLQDMTLAVQIKDAYTNRTAYFTNESRSASKPFPLIDVTLAETNRGLDALFVVTDIEPVKLAPRFVGQAATNGTMHLEWDGDGAVFQIEHAAGLSGSWTVCSPVLPDVSWDPGGKEPAGFFRVRQW